MTLTYLPEHRKNKPELPVRISPKYSDALFLMLNAGKNFVNVLDSSIHSSTSGCSEVIGSEGSGINGTAYANSDGIALTSNADFRFYNSPGTIIAYVSKAVPTSLNSVSPIIYSVRDNASTYLSLFYSNDNGSGVYGRLAIQIGATTVSCSDYSIVNNSIVAASWGANGIRLFSSEGQFASNVSTSLPSNNSVTPWLFNRSTGGRGNEGSLYSVFGVKRQLPDNEIWDILDNYWSLVKEEENYFYFGSSGGITLTIAGINQSQSLGNIDLVQQNTLAVDAVNNAQAIDNIVLVTEIILFIAASANAQTMGNIDLIQQNTLAVDAENQAQSFDNIDLIQQNTLAVNDENQAQSLGNVDLVQQNTLAINDENQAQSTSNIDLIQQNTISVNDESQAQSLESPTLDTALSIDIQNIANAQSIENITLIQQNILSVNPLNNAQSLGNIDLTQASVLSVNAVLQDQNLENIVLDFSAVLTISDIISQQVIDNISLTQANILSVYAQSQSQTLSNIVLTQQSTLIVNDLLHAQLLSNITLLDEAVPLIVSGSTVFVLRQDNRPVFVLNSKSDVFIKTRG